MFLNLDRKSASERRRKLAMINADPKNARQRTSFCFSIFPNALWNISPQSEFEWLFRDVWHFTELRKS